MLKIYFTYCLFCGLNEENILRLPREETIRNARVGVSACGFGLHKV